MSFSGRWSPGTVFRTCRGHGDCVLGCRKPFRDDSGCLVFCLHQSYPTGLPPDPESSCHSFASTEHKNEISSRLSEDVVWPDRQRVIDKRSYADGDSCHCLQNFPHGWLLDSAQRNWGSRMHLETLGPFWCLLWRRRYLRIKGRAGSVAPIYVKSFLYV